MKKNRFIVMLPLVAMTMLSACSNINGGSSSIDSNHNSVSSSKDNDDIRAIYGLYVKNMNEKGEIPLSYEEWLATIKGEPGEQGVSIVSIEKTGTEGLVDTYTITYSDGHTSTFLVTNGEKGEQGIQGVPGADGHTPIITIGENGNWFVDGADSGIRAQGPKGERGDDGISVVSITKTGSEGLTDTYTITYSDGHTSTFVVTNGEKGDQGIQGVKGEDGHTPVITVGDNGNWFVDGVDTGIHAQGPKGEKGEDGVSVVSIEKTSEAGLADIYTINYSDGHTSTFVVTNGEKGDQGIQGVKGEDGHTPVIAVGDNGNWFVDGVDTGIHAQGIQGPKGDKGDDGVSVVSVEKTSSDGLLDTYTITYSDGSTSTFTIANGAQGPEGEQGPKGDQGEKGDQGLQGEKGDDGKSAYEIYCDAHPEYQGDEQQWLDDLVNGRLGTEELTYYTVTFDLGYDSLSFTQQVQEGKKARRPENPNRDGYNFLDWVDEYNEHWVFNGYSITEDIVLHAVWSDPIEYTVTFVNNDGSILDVESGHYGETVVYHGATPKAASQDPHYYYTFSGWDTSLVITGDMVITATYISSYIATTAYYYDYDGETLLATVPLAEGETPHYDGDVPTRERDKTNKLQFEFARWNKVEETSNSIKFIAEYASCTDGLDIEGNVATYYHGTATDVVIPSVWGGQAITAIGESAFSASSVVSVSIPNSVASIGNNAFYECSSLSSVSMPDSLIMIGSAAFEGCTSLLSIVIPDSVTSIGDCAFYRCSSLFSATISASLASIPSSAFSRCSSLSSVSIPDSVTSIGYYAFDYCTSLKSIAIPSSVTSIGDNAFIGCTSLASVFVPASVASIGGYAFADLNCVIYCEREYRPVTWDVNWCGSTLVVWGYRGDRHYDVFSYAVSEIDGEQTAMIMAVDEGVTEVVIPSAIEGMPTELTCSALLPVMNSLERLIIEDGVIVGNNWNLAGFTAIQSVVLPDGLTSIGSNVFAGCSSLSSISIPDSVTSIGEDAFCDCSSLSSISIPDSVTSIERGVFYRCSSLSSVSIPDSVTSIGNNAFYYCSSLVSISIPSSVTSMGYGVFDGCSFTTIYCEAISKPDGWDAQWNNWGCLVYWGTTGQIAKESGFAYIVSGQGEDSGAIIVGYDGEQTANLTIPSTLGGFNVIRLGDSLFKECDWLENVILPENLVTLDDNCFCECSNLKTINIPSTVTSIGNYAFAHCVSLASIFIPASVTSIGYGAFYCYPSSSVKIFCEAPEKPSDWKDDWNSSGRPVYWSSTAPKHEESGFTYVVSGQGENAGAIIVGYDGEQTANLTIPSTLGGAKVVGLAENLFRKSDWLVSITLPETITTIESYCFSECKNLKEINIPSSVTSIGYAAFYYCSSLTYIFLPDSLTTIDGSAFNMCSSLKAINIPSSVTSIGYYAFGNCRSLTIYCEAAEKPDGWDNGWNSSGRPVYWSSTLSMSEGSGFIYAVFGQGEDAGAIIVGYDGEQTANLTIPSTLGGAKVVGLADELFKGCDWLESVILPDTLVSIGNYCFSGCSSLTSVTIPSSVTILGEWSFDGCSSLASIIIPSSIASINYGTFWFCGSLSEVFYAGTSAEWENVDHSVDIGYDFYQATMYFYSETEPTETGNYWHYVDGIPSIW